MLKSTARYAALFIVIILAVLPLPACGRGDAATDDAPDIVINEPAAADDTPAAPDTEPAADETPPAPQPEPDDTPTEPVDIINGIPLYISSYYNFMPDTESIPGNRYDYRRSETGADIIIAYGGDMFHAGLYEASRAEDSTYLYSRRIFDANYLSDFYVSATASLLTAESLNALILTEFDGTVHSYIIGAGGERYALTIEKADIRRENRDADSVKTALGDTDPVPVRFYNYVDYPEDTIDFETHYTEENLPADDFISGFITRMKAHNGIRIADLWYEGDKVCVDLDVYEMNEFLNAGTHTEIPRSASLFYTLASLPNVNYIEVFFGGVRVSSGHIDYTEIFNAADYRP